MVSTSGSRLIQDETVAVLWQELFPRANLITLIWMEGQMLVSETIDSLRLL